MTDQELKAHCNQWGYWCFTKRYFAPPVPQNILAQLQPRARAPKEPDGPLDADMAFFNMAIHGMAEEDMEGAICFSLYYFHGFRPVKAMASALNIGTRTFYDRMDRFARRAHKMAATIKRVHLAQTVVEKRETVEVD
ncbi:conserved hypothetical protein [Cupriavidus taiwanensis]|uniref:hypothetical protein n=1 Tax=Cupriavidus taiwanensis TaxID=164546 RepID=UPI000E132B4C|nr:hypothetical protein [Cupriavidus taiwanensis]SOY79944.1 conserved hypothetical protein [Cupriavidus taiwanensis]SOY81913.1 conserved hypothetical protein [Cupriavidus taiwanensis]